MGVTDGYDLEEILGTGAMGSVHRARQRASGGRVVAVKRVRTDGDPQLYDRIRREGEVLAALDHPHVIRLFELLDDGDGIAIVMQYASGGSLADLLDDRERIPAQEVVRITAPVADALASAHRRGVLHRDVKPANILFTSDGEPLLSDFGIARWSQAAPLTAPDVVGLGTAEYLDPEVADGAESDPRSDVYGLGVVCYQALTGRVPFGGATPLAVMRAADRGEFTPIRALAPEVPVPVAEAVQRAIARSPLRRQPDATALAGELRAAVRAIPSPAGAVPAPGAPPPPPPAPGAPAAWSPPAPAPAGSGPQTRTFGPRPPAPPEAPQKGVPKVLIGLVTLALLVTPVVVVLLLQPDPPPEAAVLAPPEEEFDRPRQPPVPAEDCPPLELPDPAPNETLLTGVFAQGACPSYVLFRPSISATTDHELRFALRPGDPEVGVGIGFGTGPSGRDVQFFVGDWDCDGTDTPGLYSPETGGVALFDGWPAEGLAGDEQYEAESVRNVGVQGGTATVLESDEGCNDVEVEPTSVIPASLPG